jgi:hypothetical protein
MKQKMSIPATVYRVYTGNTPDKTNYLLSVIATEFEAEYYVPGDREFYGSIFTELRMAQIMAVTKNYPTTAEGYASLALGNLSGHSMFAEDQYDSIEEARRFERFLSEDLSKDVYFKKAVNDTYAYVLLSDDEKVVGVFKVFGDNKEVLRINRDWGSPTWDQSEEWEDHHMVRIELRFVDVYDQMVADGEDVNLETIQPYKLGDLD